MAVEEGGEGERRWRGREIGRWPQIPIQEATLSETRQVGRRDQDALTWFARQQEELAAAALLER